METVLIATGVILIRRPETIPRGRNMSQPLEIPEGQGWRERTSKLWAMSFFRGSSLIFQPELQDASLVLFQEQVPFLPDLPISPWTFTMGLFLLWATASQAAQLPVGPPGSAMPSPPAGVFIFCWFIVLYFPSQSPEASSGTGRAEQTHTTSQ